MQTKLLWIKASIKSIEVNAVYCNSGPGELEHLSEF